MADFASHSKIFIFPQIETLCERYPEKSKVLHFLEVLSQFPELKRIRILIFDPYHPYYLFSFLQPR